MGINFSGSKNALPIQTHHTSVQNGAPSLPRPNEVGQASQFQGAVFQHGGTQKMRRGPTGNVPPRSSQSKARAPRSLASNQSLNDEAQDNFASAGGNDLPAEKRLSQVLVNLTPGRNGDEQSGGDQREKQSKNPAALSLVRPGKFSQLTGSSPLLDQARGGMVKPLPPMQSLRDVVKYVHGALQSDPTGKSIKTTLQAINAAVLRNDIKLPALTKVSEARSLLIEIFGKGYQSKGSLSSSVSSIHIMLPLWLINLSKHRTETGKLHAAARLSLPRAAPAA